MGKFWAPFQRFAEMAIETVTGQPFKKELEVTIQSISNVSGNTWRYQFSSGADISVWEHSKTATFSGCTNPANDGIFTVVAFDLDNARIDVNNPAGVAQVAAGGTAIYVVRGHALHTDATITSGKVTIDALQGFKTAAFTATVTPTVFPTTPLVGRKVFTVYNLSTDTMLYLGSSGSHTVANSIPIYPQDAWTFDLSDLATNTYFFTAVGTLSILIVEGS